MTIVLVIVDTTELKRDRFLETNRQSRAVGCVRLAGVRYADSVAVRLAD